MQETETLTEQQTVQEQPAKTERRRASKDWFRRYYRERRLELIKLLGGQCAKCYNADEKELDFDHIDPHTKSFTIARLMNYSKEKVLAELKKCQLLCKECHVEKTQGEYERQIHVPSNKGKLTHGSHGYVKGCRCALCLQWNNLRNARRRRNG